MYVVGVGLKKVYKAWIRLARGTFSAPLLRSMSEAFSVPFVTLIKLCYKKALEGSSLVPGPEAKSSSEITNPTLFTISYHRGQGYLQIVSTCGFPLVRAWGSPGSPRRGFVAQAHTLEGRLT